MDMIEELNIPKNALLRYLKGLRKKNRVTKRIIPSRLTRDEIVWSLTDREIYKLAKIRINARRIGLIILMDMIENNKTIHEVNVEELFKDINISVESWGDISKDEKLNIIKDQHDEWKITASKEKGEW